MTTFYRRQPAPTTGIFPPTPTPSPGVPYFPQVIGPSTALGRLASGTGPVEPIPFSALGAILVGANVTQYITTGNITVTINDQVIIINKSVAAPTAITLPDATLFVAPYLEIYDWGGNAGDMTFTPNGAQKINGLSSWVVGSMGVAGGGGSLRLKPITNNVIGWAVR